MFNSIATEVTPSSKEAIAERLAEARPPFTLELLQPLDDEQLNRVYSPILSPRRLGAGPHRQAQGALLVQTIGGQQPAAR